MFTLCIIIALLAFLLFGAFFCPFSDLLRAAKYKTSYEQRPLLTRLSPRETARTVYGDGLLNLALATVLFMYNFTPANIFGIAMVCLYLLGVISGSLYIRWHSAPNKGRNKS